MPGAGVSMFEGGSDSGGGGGNMPPATIVGQVLFSVDGLTFTAEQPLTAPDHGSAGWLVNDLGILLVTG